MPAISTRLIRSLEEFGPLEDVWNPLLKRSLNDNPFLTWEWVSTWVSVYVNPDDLFVIAVYREDELIAIAPFWLDRVRLGGILSVRTLRFLGAGELCPDYLDLIVDRENQAEGLKAIWDQLFGSLRHDWDVWQYSDVPSGSANLNLVYQWGDADDRCMGRQLVDFTVCPYLPLPQSWEQFNDSLSTSRRYGLNLSRKRLSENGALEFQLPASDTEVERQLQRLRDLNTETWRARGGTGSFVTERFRSFHDRFAKVLRQQDRLLLCSLCAGDRYLGTFYGFSYNDVLFYYIMSVIASEQKRVNTGDVLLSHCMEVGVQRGCREFDFLRGPEAYKYRWTNLDRRNLHSRFLNRTSRAAAYSAWQNAIEGLKHVANGVLGLSKSSGK